MNDEEIKSRAKLPVLQEPTVIDPIPFDKADFHIFLFIGQSNMSGRAPMEDQDKAVLDKAYLLNKENQWEPAQPWVLPESTLRGLQGLNRYSTVEVLTKINGVNPALYFTKNVTVNQPNIALGIVANAKGGTLISEWLRGTELYNEAVHRTRVAMSYGVLKGIMWQQGESDRGKADYVDTLVGLIADLREDLGLGNVPFIAGEVPYVGTPDKVQASEEFNKHLSELPNRVASTAVVSAAGLTDIGDGLHINAAGQRIFGQRFAQKALEMIYGMQEADIRLQ